MLRPSVVLALVLAACRSAPAPSVSVPDTTSTKDALLAADRAFADSTAARGLDGWMDFYAADAVRLTMGGDVAQGLEAVRKFDAPLFADSTTRLLWTPTGAGLFADGQHGFTTGTSMMVRTAATRTDTIYRGAYVTLWRREADGQWKVILDTGS